MTQNALELPPTGNLWRTEQLLELGYGPRAIHSLLDSGVIVRLRYGCYIRASLWRTQSPTVWWTGCKMWPIGCLERNELPTWCSGAR